MDTTTDVSASTGRDRRRRLELAMVAAGILLAVLPVIAVVLTRSGHSFVPLGDEATVDLRVRDVFTSNTPLVGAYSRGFNHPGPILFWLLAPLSAIFGGAAWATLVGAALAQGVAIAASGVVAFRRGGVLLGLGVLAALGLAYSSFALGIQFLQPWNPNVAFPFFMLFLLLVWSVAIGYRWSVVGVAIVGSLLVQLHIGYLAVVVVPAAWAGLVVGLDLHRREARPEAGGPDEQPRWRHVGAVAAVSLIVLWAAPIYQQVARSPGNLGEIVRYFRDGGSSVGLVKAAGVYAAEFRIPPPWLGGIDRLEVFTDRVIPESLGWLLILVAFLAVGVLAARRSGRRPDQLLILLSGVTAATSIVAISRVDVELQHFLFSWRVISAIFVVLAAAWAVANWARIDERPAMRIGVAIVLLVVIGSFFGVRMRDDVLRHREFLGNRDEYARELVSRVRRAGLPEHPVLVRGLGSTSLGFAQGLVDELDRDGVPARVDPEFGYQYGEGRTATPSDVSEVWYVTPFGRNREVLDRSPGARVVAQVSSLPPADERELRALQRSVRSQLEAAGRTDLVQYLDTSLFSFIVKRQGVPGVSRRAASRIASLNARVEARGGCRCLIIGFDPHDVPPDVPFSMGF